MIHIYQGGTLHTFCGTPIRLLPEGERDDFVVWNDAHEATCPGCIVAFGIIAVLTN